MREIKNAIVRSTTLGREDHGIMSAYIGLDFGGSFQSFGGYALDQWDDAAKKRVGTAWGLQFVMNVLDALKIETWEKLIGTPCRVDADRGKIYRIGHLLDDRWFDPAEKP